MSAPEPIKPAGGVSPLLSIEALSLFVQNGAETIPIVRDVFFSISPGECFALVGESGSGKTMIARAIMRLLSPKLLRIDGRILFDGEDLATASASRMRMLRGCRIAMIFQEPMSSLNPLMPIGTQIDEAIKAHQILSAAARHDLVISLLTEVQFKDPDRIARMYPHELSGGMRQRVMIAIAVANKPALLIADEPTTALDVSIQAEVMDILHRLRTKFGIAVLFISHDLSLVARHADRVGVLYGGEIMEITDARDMVAAPQHPYSAALISCVPRRRARGIRQSGIDGSVSKLATDMPGCRFSPRCAHTTPACDEGRVPALERGSRLVRCIRPLA
jgi:peptide/nickel transport system ATP-binding protein